MSASRLADPQDAFDTIVVGGSWAGLSAAMQLARLRRRVLVVDAGRPRNRFSPASHGVLGHDGRAPGEIMDAARAQLLAYPTAAFRRDEATHAGGADGAPAGAADGGGVDPEFLLTLASGTQVRARRLVLATGIVDELPELPGLRERWGKTVLHCPYCHGYEVRDGRLGVLARGAPGVHTALLLGDLSANVTLFTGGTFDLADAERDALHARGVRVEPRPVSALLGEAPALAGVRLADGTVVGLDALFTAPRATRMASPLADQLGCAFDDGPTGPIIRVDARKATSVPGVYAAGDAASAMWNATLASADGVLAGVMAHQSLALAPAR